MDENVTKWFELVFRWVHVLAGILWIGHLYFFNFVNAHVAKTYDADSKKKVVPELMPRALYWFRLGAIWTWATGFLLLGMVYYMNASLLTGTAPGEHLGNGALIGISVAILLVPFFVYDAIWKSGLAKNEMAGVAVSLVLVAAVVFGLSRVMGGRAVWIHTGALFGSIMMMNVWMRIWPSQRKIIAGIKGTAPAPDAAVPALAGLRSKHNTYMSVPLVLMMVSNHYGQATDAVVGGNDIGWVLAIVMVLIGFGIAKFLYLQSAKASPTQF